MLTLCASMVASLAGWLVDAPVRSVLGPVPSTVVSLLVSTVAFFVAKRVLADLRG